MIYLKRHVLAQVMAAYSNQPDFLDSEFVRHYPDISFEPLAASASGRVALRYNYYYTREKNKRENFGALIPVSRWASDREGLTQEAAARILDLFGHDSVRNPNGSALTLLFKCSRHFPGHFGSNRSPHTANSRPFSKRLPPRRFGVWLNLCGYARGLAPQSRPPALPL